MKYFKRRTKLSLKVSKEIHIVVDDIIIAASDIEEHNVILHQVLQRATECNVKLNFDKFQLCVIEVKYLDTIISHEGMKPDPAKVKSITVMLTPNDKPAVCRLLGMINYLAPHIPNMASICLPLCDLYTTDVHFQWNTLAQDALMQIKAILSTEPVLCFFDPTIARLMQLAIVFACSKFHQYIYGFYTRVQTDHKPLEIIF